MDASDIRDEDFNPSNFEDPEEAQQGGYDEQEGVEGQHDDGTTHQQQEDEGQLRQDVLQGLGVSNAAYHFAVAAHNAEGQGDMGIGEMNVVHHGVGEGGVPDDLNNLVGVTGDEEGHEQQAQDLGYDLTAQHQGMAQEDSHGYGAEPQGGTEYAEDHHPTTVLDDHHLSTNQFPNPDMRLPSIPHAAAYHHHDVTYAEQNPEHMEINLDMVGELGDETTLASNHVSNSDQQGMADQADAQVGDHHLAMDPSIGVSPEAGNREPASGKAPRARHFGRKTTEMSAQGTDDAAYTHAISDLSASADAAGPSSRRRTAAHGSGHKPMADPSGTSGNAAAGPSTSVSVDPDTPLSIDEIRRRQNRSRASGKVLPRGGACDFCKRRKLRCDGVRPECGHCAKHPNRQCVYSQRKPRTKVELLEYRLAELEQRLGEIGDPLHGGLHDTLSAIEESASPSLPPAPMDGQTPPPQMHVDLGQSGVNELDQTLHIDPILNQVAQAAEAEQRRQREEQEQEEQREREQGQEHEGLRDLEMPSVGEHDQGAQHGGQGERVGDFDMPAIDGQDNGMDMTATAGMSQQEIRMEEMGDSRSPGPSASSRSVTIKQLIERLVKGVEDVLNDTATPESKVGEKVVWSLMTMFQERASSYGYTRHINRFASSLIGFGVKPHQSLLYAILAATCLLPYGPYPNEIATYPLRALGPHFLAHAEREVSASTFHSIQHDTARLIDTVQSCALIAQVKYSEGRLLEGWMIAGQGLKLAIAMGLNRISLNDYDGGQSVEQDYGGDFGGDVRGRASQGRGAMTLGESHRNVSEQQRVLLQLKGYTVVTPPAPDVAELGERIHLFWSTWSAERIGSLALGYGSSLNSSEITTPWPETIESYTTLADNPHSLQLRDESVYELSHPTAGSPAREDTAHMFELKLLFLLGESSDLLNDLTCLNDRNAARRVHQLAHIQREAVNLSDIFQSMKTAIPADIAVPPVVGGPGSGGSKIRKGFPRNKIWIHALLNTLSMNLELLKSMSDPDGIDDLPDEAAMTYAEFVAKLGKATDPHEHSKIEPAFIVVWHIVGRYLTGRNQVYWNQGRINDAKRVDTISALVIDTMRSFAKYHQLATQNLDRLENIRKYGSYTKEGEWHLSGAEALSAMRQA